MARLLALILPDVGPGGAGAGLCVLGVEPAPDASRLRVRLSPLGPGEGGDAWLAVLERARAHIRAQVAEGIRRRRAPDLVFRLEPAGGAP